MHWNLLTLRRLLVLLVCCGVQTSLLAQSLALSAPVRPLPYGDELKQQEPIALTNVLEQLERDYDVRFNYASQLVENKTVRKDRITSDEVLEKQLHKLLPPLGLRFEKVNNQIYGIYPIPQKKAKQQTPKNTQSSLREAQLDLIARLGLRPLQAVATAERALSGTVTDSEDGGGLPGVNVLVKNTTIGTVTDIDGRYTISAPDDAEALVFSSVGYLSQEVAIGNQTTIDLGLEADVKSLEEVVVVGYGTQKKSDLTGSVASVEPEDINRVSERRLENALQGRAPGVQVTRGEGKPGSGASVNIRGAGSIGDTEPLWIVDGVPQNPGNYFNMNDVESIEILKDASASAIYGARAAHGVILVTTKRGSDGQVRVNFRSSVGQRSPVGLPDMLNTLQFAEVSSRNRLNADQTPESAWANPEGLPNTDWVDEVYSGDGLEQSYNLSVSGGTENANFFVSGAYDNENGIMIDNYFRRYAFRANADFKIGKRIKIGESLLVSRTRENPTEGADLITVFRAIPIMPVYDPTNPFGGWGTAPTYFQGPNPLAVQLQNPALNTVNRINGNVYAEVEFVEGLTLRGSVGANVTSQRREKFSEAYNYGPLSNPINSLEHRSLDTESLNTNLVLTYQKEIGRHNFLVLGGYERFQEDGVDFGALAQDFPVDYSRSFALAAGTVDINNRNTISSQYRLQSLFGRINYTFDNKYLLTANVRRDGSSRFGSENQYGIFPSVSVGWRIIEEGFMEGASFLSDLKLRASYGVLGSDRIGDYIFAKTYRNDGSTYIFDASGLDGGNKVRGFYQRRFPNELVKWEEVEQTNIGMDLGLLEGKFNLTADYYVKTTNDMLIGVQLPLSYGVSTNNQEPQSPETNLGSVENRGFELSFNYRENVGNWNFNVTANSSWNSNEVQALNADDRISAGGGGPLGGNIAVTEAGQPIGSYFGWIVDGIFQDQATIDALNEAAPEGSFYQEQGTAPGDFRYRDIDGDGQITPDDRTFIGNPWPKMIYGLNVNVNYRSFDFTLFLQGVQGVDLFNILKSYYRQVHSDYNTTTQVYDAWTPENPTEHPRLIANDPNGNFRRPSSYFVEDGSFLKVRNIQLGYTLPLTLVERIGLTNARVFVNAQNILTLTQYEGIDPEVGKDPDSNNFDRNTSLGFDGLNQYPQTQLLSAGVQFGF